MDAFGGDAARGRDTRALAACLGEGFLDKGEQAARGGQQQDRSVTILHAGRMGEGAQAETIGLDEGAELGAYDLFADAVAARPAAFFRFLGSDCE